MPLPQPVLERLQAADIRRRGLTGAVLQQLTAGDRLALLLQHLGQILGPQLASASQGPGRQLPHPLFTETMTGGGELLQHLRRQRPATSHGD